MHGKTFIGNRSQGSFDDVCPWESMEKLPDKEAKPSSLPQSAAPAAANKPSTSSAAQMSTAPVAEPIKPNVTIISGKAASETNSVATTLPSSTVAATATTVPASPPTTVVTSTGPTPAPRKDSMLTTQVSVTSVSSSPAHQASPTPASPSLSLSSATDNLITVVSPPLLQHSVANNEGGGGTLAEGESSTSASKESVMHTSPTMKATNSSSVHADQQAWAQQAAPIPGMGDPGTTTSSMMVDSAMHLSTSPPQMIEQNRDPYPCTSNNNTNIPLSTGDNTRQRKGDNAKEVCPWDHE